MTVTWTSGYSIDEAEPLVEWGKKGGEQMRSLAVTLTFDRNSMCGALTLPKLHFGEIGYNPYNFFFLIVCC